MRDRKRKKRACCAAWVYCGYIAGMGKKTTAEAIPAVRVSPASQRSWSREMGGAQASQEAHSAGKTHASRLLILGWQQATLAGWQSGLGYRK